MQQGDTIIMLLTNQQKCIIIMEILSKIGCIRRNQLLALLYGKYRERVMTMRPEHLTPMLHQLSGISHAVCVEDDVIRLITKTANPLLLESVDVMLEITGGCPLQFSTPTSLPALLCFLYGDELTAYYVAALTAEREPSFRRMDLTMPIYLGASDEHLAAGAAVLGQTSVPIGGDSTNAVIAGHRGWQGADYFRYIDLLQVGDEVTVTNLWEKLTYTVTEISIIQPHEVDKIRIQSDRDLLTLLTCHPYASGGRQRYVVVCERTEN